MFRNIPTANKICSTKETFQNQQTLYSHVQTMRPQIDNKAPKKYEFLQNAKIKEAVRSQKQQEIDRENRNLITKITNIMSTTQANNTQSIQNIKRSQSSNVAVLPKRSLNKDHRKKELIKIVMENQQLLKRIQDQRSSYNVRTWDQERKWVEKYISNISEYPYKDFKPTKTLVQFWSNSRISETSMQKRDPSKKLEPIGVKSQQQRSRKNLEEIKESQIDTQKSLFASNYDPNYPSTFYQPFEPQSIYYMKDDPLLTNNTQQNLNQSKENKEQVLDHQPLIKLEENNFESNENQNQDIQDIQDNQSQQQQQQQQQQQLQQQQQQNKEQEKEKEKIREQEQQQEQQQEQEQEQGQEPLDKLAEEQQKDQDENMLEENEQRNLEQEQKVEEKDEQDQGMQTEQLD